jgi:uncharacterized protein YfkK (UPF0435 family)
MMPLTRHDKGNEINRKAKNMQNYGEDLAMRYQMVGRKERFNKHKMGQEMLQ